MSDDLPEIFKHVTPRPAPIGLRQHVLARVDCELAHGVSSRWQRVFEFSSVATLLIGVALNVWSWRIEENWQARLYGPAPVPARIVELAEIVGSATDSETGRQLQERLMRQWRDSPRPNFVVREQYEQLLRNLMNEKAPPV